MDDIQHRITEWLLETRQAAWDVVEAADWKPLTEQEQDRVVIDSPMGWSLDSVNVLRNPLRIRELENEWAETVARVVDPGPPRSLVEALASIVVAPIPATQLMWSSSREAGDGNAPIIRCLLNAAVAYSRALDRLDRDDPVKADAIAGELEAFLGWDVLRYLVQVPLSGLTTPHNELCAGGVVLRRLTEDEVGNFAASPVGWPGYVPSNFPSLNSVVMTHMLEFELTSRRPGPMGVMATGIEHVTALQLLGFDMTGTGAAIVRPRPTWMFGHSQFGRSGLPRQNRSGDPRECSKADLSRAVSVASSLDETEIRQPSGPRSLSLHRFAQGCERSNPIDALLDFIICLEALLLPGMNQELGFRFQLNGAWWLHPHDVSARTAAHTRLKHLYKARSDLAHGSRFPSGDEAKKLADDARTFAAASLLKAVEQGWPSASDFLTLILEGQ